MRSPRLALAVLLLAAAAPAAASLTEPSGLVVPQDSQNGETQLSTLFSSLGEPVDWQADAHLAPVALLPRCSLTAALVLHQAGLASDLAWYPVRSGGAPAAADLHVLLPGSSPVGTTVSVDLCSDPAYPGGAIGFALIAHEPHYANPAFNTVCTECTTPGPWITGLAYRSKNLDDAYYLAFEDGTVTSTTWANDGDFNDDVFLVTGLLVPTEGATCDTGRPGRCAAGVNVPVPGGVECQGLHPPATEQCDGVDDDCDGAVDNGAGCAAGTACVQGRCRPACGPATPCAEGTTCGVDGVCVAPACATASCHADQACHAGTCRDACAGVVCPAGQRCAGGACVDPCAGVSCGALDICVGGACVASCADLPCAEGMSCDAASGRCLSDACPVSCAAGTRCVEGACVDACAGVACPLGQACEKDAQGNAACSPCPAGAVSATPGAACATCGEGTYQPLTGQEACLACTAGAKAATCASDAGGGGDGCPTGESCAPAAGGGGGCQTGATGGLAALGLLGLALWRRRRAA